VEADLRIDELARVTGLSVRNLRSHHERGLLPPPEVRSRVGYYGEEHIARIRLIQELQAEGLKLDGIKRLLDESDATGDGLLRVKQAAEALADTEASEVVDAEELRRRFDVDDGIWAKAIAAAERVGAVVPLGQGRYELPSPSLIAAAEEVVRRGITLDHALAIVADVGRHAEAISKRFVEQFVHDVWKPFVASGMPEDEWPRIAEAMESTRAVAPTVVLAVFRQKMGAEAEAAFAQIAKRLSEGKR
jgi:DNA-binding transcriptional MerR regulator